MKHIHIFIIIFCGLSIATDSTIVVVGDAYSTAIGYNQIQLEKGTFTFAGRAFGLVQCYPKLAIGIGLRFSPTCIMAGLNGSEIGISAGLTTGLRREEELGLFLNLDTIYQPFIFHIDGGNILLGLFAGYRIAPAWNSTAYFGAMGTLVFWR